VAFEQAYEKEKSTANALAVIAKYNEFINQYPNDKDLSARYLYRIASIYYETGSAKNALETLEKGINNYDHKDATPRSLMLEGTIHQANGRLTEAIIAFAHLTRKYPNHPDAEKAKKMIPTEEKLNVQIENLKKTMTDTTLSPGLNRSVYPQLANAYMQSVAINPKVEDAATRLKDAGELYMSVGDAKSAAKVWEQLIAGYPTTDAAKSGMFQLAFCYEQFFKDLEKAKAMYERFLKKYPDDQLATSAEFSLQNLGKSADEIIQGFDAQ
jgi:TolA-binding protein